MDRLIGPHRLLMSWRMPYESGTGEWGAMAAVHDIAAFILEKQGQMTAMKLQKLAYYCQAWHLAYHGRALFPEPIQAWTNGPMVLALWESHRNARNVTAWSKGDPAKLDRDERGSVLLVLKLYGSRSGDDLSKQTHEEDPWLEARRDLQPWERGKSEVSTEAMRTFYRALFDREQQIANNPIVKFVESLPPEYDELVAELATRDRDNGPPRGS